jgi:hypothetical protein
MLVKGHNLKLINSTFFSPTLCNKLNPQTSVWTALPVKFSQFGCFLNLLSDYAFFIRMDVYFDQF